MRRAELASDVRGGTQGISYLMLVAGIALVAIPVARALDRSSRDSFEGSTVRFDRPGTYVGGDVGGGNGGGGRGGGGGDATRSWTVPEVAEAVLPGGGEVVVAGYQETRQECTAGAPSGPARPRYVIGGSRGAGGLDFGHTWIAVELPDGRIRKLDFRAAGYEGGSSGALGTIYTDGDAGVTDVGSWDELARGGDEMYGFETTPEAAQAVFDRMRAYDVADPDYSVLLNNCTDAVFSIAGAADRSWRWAGRLTITPSQALDRTRRACAGAP
jgi:hypothetical protein